MVFTFDSLSYARHLREHGVPAEQAEAQADAARQFIMAELVTKADMYAALTALEARLDAKIDALALRLDTKIDTLALRLDTKIDTLSLRLTVRLGGLLVAGIAALATILKLS